MNLLHSVVLLEIHVKVANPLRVSGLDCEHPPAGVGRCSPRILSTASGTEFWEAERVMARPVDGYPHLTTNLLPIRPPGASRGNNDSAHFIVMLLQLNEIEHAKKEE